MFVCGIKRLVLFCVWMCAFGGFWYLYYACADSDDQENLKACFSHRDAFWIGCFVRYGIKTWIGVTLVRRFATVGHWNVWELNCDTTEHRQHFYQPKATFSRSLNTSNQCTTSIVYVTLLHQPKNIAEYSQLANTSLCFSTAEERRGSTCAAPRRAPRRPRWRPWLRWARQTERRRKRGLRKGAKCSAGGGVVGRDS